MAPKEREAWREQQRLSYRATGRKEAIIVGVKRRRELQKHTLHHESIAMENPLFIPELVWPTAGASRAHGTMTKSSDWVISESSATPLYIPPPNEEVNDEGCDELLLAIWHIDHMLHVDKDMHYWPDITRCLSVALARTQGHLIKMVTAWLKTEWVLTRPWLNQSWPTTVYIDASLSHLGDLYTILYLTDPW